MQLEKDDKWFIVVDGVEGKQYDEVELVPYKFSGDFKQLVYKAKNGGKWFVVLNGVEGKQYDGSGFGPLPEPVETAKG